MKKTQLLLLTIFILGVLSSCIQEPDAIFSVSSDEYKTDEVIQFNNESMNGQSYMWNFGDGTSSAQVNPTHSYKYAGDYTVTLNVVNNDLESNTSMELSIIPGFKPTIFEGEGFEDISLGDQWGYVKTMFGIADTVYFKEYVEHYDEESNQYYGTYYHSIYYPQRGFVGLWVTETEYLLETDRLYMIYLFVENDGITYTGISFNNTIDDVYDAYGSPLSTPTYSDANGYWYDDLGIDFYEFNNSGFVDEIDIYPVVIQESSAQTYPAQKKSVQLKDYHVKEYVKNFDRTRFKGKDSIKN